MGMIHGTATNCEGTLNELAADRRVALGTAARRHAVEQFSAAPVVSDILDYYQRVVAG